MDFKILILRQVGMLFGTLFFARELSITYNAFSKYMVVKDMNVAKILISPDFAKIKTSMRLRNRMSFWGVAQYMLAFLLIPFFIYDWYIYASTGLARHCVPECILNIVLLMMIIIGSIVKGIEARKFEKDKMELD